MSPRGRSVNIGGTAMSHVPSPCRSVCRYDAARGLCLGCGRTLAEIAGWIEADDAQRRAIIAHAEARLDREHGTPCVGPEPR